MQIGASISVQPNKRSAYPNSDAIPCHSGHEPGLLESVYEAELA
ncbi:hypothetical protein CA85_41640 [Allorhodopirellula solitaria]|uniref:Uncharacterized protein n=1 Tax=Allorhodopirellula solitaria TaxID=2527987 RepID=A0A5C5X1F5_9BACT|nr:hypothetical protein CA85_41640 [Allorhodopirellula solitaria]